MYIFESYRLAYLWYQTVMENQATGYVPCSLYVNVGGYHGRVKYTFPHW